jgi:hypothetical protein
MKVDLILNLNHGIRKSKAKTQCECKMSLFQKEKKIIANIYTQNWC